MNGSLRVNILLNEATHSLAIKLSNSGVVVIDWRDLTRFFLCIFLKSQHDMANI